MDPRLAARLRDDHREAHGHAAARESTIRFEGVAEGMVAVSAIVTGLPGGTIEKNRNADLLSPASLVDGTLGNRVTVTRTNPATGGEVAEQAVVRTRADGGLVLQTGAGFEAVRCSGLPEKLTFDRVPAGLVGTTGVQRRHPRSERRHLHHRADVPRLGLRLAGALCRHAGGARPGRRDQAAADELADPAQRQRPELPRCRAAGGCRQAQRSERLRGTGRSARGAAVAPDLLSARKHRGGDRRSTKGCLAMPRSPKSRQG